MSLFGVFDIAGTALNAQSIRLNVTTSNMANADAVSSSVESTYRARQPVFASLVDKFSFDSEFSPARVQVRGIVESDAPLRKEYKPEHPLADAEGYIFRPNVNAIEEMANMLSASRSYQNNIEVVNAAKQMLLRTLSLGQ